MQAELGKHLEDERIVMYYDRSIPDGEAADLLQAHRFRLDQIEARLSDHFPRRITSYVYANSKQKRRLMGAGQVYIAKPWLDEIHLNKRAGYFTVMALDYLGSANLADSANTFNIVPDTVRAGDMLLERWQRSGIGHTLVVKDVVQLGEGNYGYLPRSAFVAAGSPTRTPISLDNYTQWTTTLGVGLAFR